MSRAGNTHFLSQIMSEGDHGADDKLYIIHTETTGDTYASSAKDQNDWRTLPK